MNSSMQVQNSKLMRLLTKKLTLVFLTCMLFMHVAAPFVAHADFANINNETKANFKKAVVACGATQVILALVGAISGGLNVPTNDVPGNFKEMLDCIFWNFKVAAIMGSIGISGQYIQTGMNGNPAFPQNLRAYFLTLTDKVAGNYIENVAPYLCSPFRNDIKLQLNLLYKNISGRAPEGVNGSSCTLTDSVKNIENFLEGDFYSGGWEGWQAMFENPQNNPYGAYFEARGELLANLDAASADAEKKLDFGNGFLSKEEQECYETEEVLDDGTVVKYQECDEPRVLTPGSEVQNSLQLALQTAADLGIAADELQENFSIVAFYIFADILTNDGGLAGYDPKDFDQEVPEIPDDITPDDDPPPTAGASLTFTQNGELFTASQGSSRREFRLPVEQASSYTQAIIDYDVFVDEFNGNVFNGALVDLVRKGEGIYFGSWINAANNKTIVDKGNGDQDGKVHPWAEKTNYHVRAHYDGEEGHLTMNITNKDTGEVMQQFNVPMPKRSLYDAGEGLMVGFGLEQPVGDDAFYPPYGWKFSNLRVEVIGSGGTN